MNYQTSIEIEYAVSLHFNPRRYVIVPNVSWGMFRYELDLCLLNHNSRYASEVEIKVSKSDLKRDEKKEHNHDRNGNMIRNLWFAMPDRMRDCLDLVPVHAGILLVGESGSVTAVRNPRPNPAAQRWTDDKAYELARLGTMRVWTLKRRIVNRMQTSPKNERIVRIKHILDDLKRTRERNNELAVQKYAAETKLKNLHYAVGHFLRTWDDADDNWEPLETLKRAMEGGGE